MGKMMTNNEEPEQKEWAKAVRIVFPASPDFGTHGVTDRFGQI